MTWTRTAWILATVALTACNGGSSGPDDAGGFTLAGTYTGTVHWNPGTPMMANIIFVLDFIQGDLFNSSSFHGTFTTDAGTSGTLGGLLIGTPAGIAFNMQQTVPCEGFFSGTMTVTNSGDRISGSYHGTTPCTGPISANFVVDRS